MVLIIVIVIVALLVIYGIATFNGLRGAQTSC